MSRLFIHFLQLSLVTCGLAQTADTELAAELAASEKSVLRGHKMALETLEKERAAAGDYEGAQRAKAAWDTLVKSQFPELLPAATLPAAVSVQERATISLPMTGTAVSYNGGAKPLGAEGVLLAGRDAGMKWSALNVDPGEYEVSVDYGVEAALQKMVMDRKTKLATFVQPKWGGEIAFEEVASLRTSGRLLGTVTPFQLNSTATKLTVKLGRIRLATKRADLALEGITAPEAPNEYGGICRVLNIHLTPTVKSVINGEPADVATLRSKYQAAMAGRSTTWVSLLQGFRSVEEVQSRKDFQEELARMGVTAVPDADTKAQTAIQPELMPADKREKVVFSMLDRIGITTTGEIRLANDGAFLERLKPKGARISVQLKDKKLPAGAYRVRLATRMTSKYGGAYKVKVGFNEVSGTLTFTNSEDGIGGAFLADGVLDVAPGAPYLELHVEDLAFKDGSLCELKAIELIPTAASK